MRQLMLCLLMCVLVDGLGTMLVQARADTLRVLQDVIRHSKPTSTQRPPVDELDFHRKDGKPSKDLHSTPLDGRRSEKTLRLLRRGRPRRHISNAVIESGHCDHVDLVDCSDFESDEMTCMMTATGMTCCVCTGALRAAKRDLF